VTPGFQSEVELTPLSKADIIARGLPLRWHGQLNTELVCVSSFCGTFTIPVGFLTDGATIPKIFWNVLSDTDPNILYPAFAHDFCYSVHGNLPNAVVTKDQADQMLREQMKILGAPIWQCDAVYRAVHWFGGGHFIAKLVGMRRAWSDVTHPAKLSGTSYATKSHVRIP
jgi:Protein of unknown function (DUF1353)